MWIISSWGATGSPRPPWSVGPSTLKTLLGDPSNANAKLGWRPTTTLEELVAEMVAADKEEARKEAILRLKDFPVVGSMENPPTNPVAVAQARGGQD